MLDDQTASLDKGQAMLDASDASYQKRIDNANAKLEERKKEIASANQKKLLMLSGINGRPSPTSIVASSQSRRNASRPNMTT